MHSNFFKVSGLSCCARLSTRYDFTAVPTNVMDSVMFTVDFRNCSSSVRAARHASSQLFVRAETRRIVPRRCQYSDLGQAHRFHCISPCLGQDFVCRTKGWTSMFAHYSEPFLHATCTR